MREYTVILTPDPAGGYTLDVPALPGCFTEGESEQEALANAKDVIALWLEQLAADGKPIPEDVPTRKVAV